MTDREVRAIKEFDEHKIGFIGNYGAKDAEYLVSQGLCEYTQPQPNDIATGACEGKFCSQCQTPICKIVYKTEKKPHVKPQPKDEKIECVVTKRAGKYQAGDLVQLTQAEITEINKQAQNPKYQ